LEYIMEPEKKPMRVHRINIETSPPGLRKSLSSFS
jgi:hypothetical protein